MRKCAPGSGEGGGGEFSNWPFVTFAYFGPNLPSPPPTCFCGDGGGEGSAARKPSEQAVINDGKRQLHVKRMDKKW